MMNRVTIAGRLGADPESKEFKGGALCHFTVATSEKYTDRDREKHELVEWHKVSVWGKFADSCMKYLRKGSAVLVEGKLKTRSWEDEAGVKRYVTEIIASRVVFLDSKRESGEVTY